MALNFPNSPTNGQLYTDSASGNRWVWDSGNTCWVSTSTFTQTITVASSAPGSPVAGQLWWNKDYGRLLVYYTDNDTSQWVDASPSDYTSQLAYNQANTVFGVANAAFGKANNALANTTGTFAGNLGVSGNISVSSTTTNCSITATSTSGGGQMTMSAFQGTLGTIGSTNNIGVELITNSIRRMFVDTNGYVTTPYQPRVYATKTTGDWTNYGTSGATFIFNNAIINVGNNYNSSTGIFTSPISGYYRVSAAILLGYGSGTTGFYLYKNGSAYGHSVYVATYTTSVHATTGFNWMVNCSAGDTLKIHAWSGSSTTVYEPYYNHLLIELIG